LGGDASGYKLTQTTFSQDASQKQFTLKTQIICKSLNKNIILILGCLTSLVTSREKFILTTSASA